jgi:glucose-6-phosphate isomerase
VKGEAAGLGPLAEAVQERLRSLSDSRAIPRIWHKDPTVWKPGPETPEIADRLGWLTVAEDLRSHVAEMQSFAEETRSQFNRVVLCGMGGSSLAPEVCWRTFGRRRGFPSLLVLDTTEPATIQAVGKGAALKRTLFLISSKSGTTQETSSLFGHFWEATRHAGERFVAVTDPQTPLARLAAERGFRRTFLNPTDIGGRYSALSYFGLVPAALMGGDVDGMLESGIAMAASCRNAAGNNPGAWLGAVLGEAALAGRDKLTLLLSPAVASLGLWVEQLVAESTGKEGKGILPVVETQPADPASYGPDRVFVAVRLARERAGAAMEPALEGLRAAGHPVIELSLPHRAGLGGEFFRWEFATAVACSILGVNAFDQPNVAESKANTKALLAGGVSRSPAADPSAVQAFLGAVRPGDYVALLAYVAPSEANDTRLASVAAKLSARTRAAATAAYGPRYLHSTGQLHKGGPVTGHFLVVMGEPAASLPIPGEPFDFGTLFLAQAEGDLGALARRGRPALRVDSLDQLEAAL